MNLKTVMASERSQTQEATSVMSMTFWAGQSNQMEASWLGMEVGGVGRWRVTWEAL